MSDKEQQLFWKSNNFRKRAIKARTDTKKYANKIRVIALQGAIEKSPILLYNIGNWNDWMAP